MTHEHWCPHCGKDRRLIVNYCCEKIEEECRQARRMHEDNLELIHRAGIKLITHGPSVVHVSAAHLADWLREKGYT